MIGPNTGAANPILVQVPVVNAILANEIPMMLINQDVTLPHIKAGSWRPP
jgi:hypothetical protein